jgi:hypothetical protein
MLPPASLHRAGSGEDEIASWKTRSLAGIRFPASTSGESSRAPELAGVVL